MRAKCSPVPTACTAPRPCRPPTIASLSDITARYAELNPLILTVMNGGLIPTAEIVGRLSFGFEQDYLHATRYRGATSGGGLT